jgi:hypothetical protein
MAIEEVLSTGLVMNFTAFLAACTFPPGAFVLVEQIPRHVFASREEREGLLRFALLGDAIDLSISTSGRVFHQDFELRWERKTREAEAAQVVYLGKAEALPSGLLPDQKLDKWRAGLEPRSKEYYLFGTLLDTQQLREMGLPENQHSYAEVRVPRLLYYPVEAYRLQLMVREYVEKSTGQVKLLRFEGLKPVEGRKA